MRFTEIRLPGAFLIDIEPRIDSRGFFARSFCQQEFVERGLNPVVAQANLAFNPKRGTLRGMHFQFPPHSDTKLVRATRGAILDVIVDLRPESATYLQTFSIELSADNHRALYVPQRFAHGYQTLEDNTEAAYQAGEYYAPGFEAGLSPFDPRLNIEWPLPVVEVSEKDRGWTQLDLAEMSLRQRMAIA